MALFENNESKLSAIVVSQMLKAAFSSCSTEEKYAISLGVTKSVGEAVEYEYRSMILKQKPIQEAVYFRISS